VRRQVADSADPWRQRDRLGVLVPPKGDPLRRCSIGRDEGMLDWAGLGPGQGEGSSLHSQTPLQLTRRILRLRAISVLHKGAPVSGEEGERDTQRARERADLEAGTKRMEATCPKA
jgi:hypothetical protein